MEFRLLAFDGFEGRDEKLKNIIRYHAFNPMWYRTNLYIHSHRIVWLVEELIPYAIQAYPNFDAEAARTMAAIHDDLEISLGDIMLAEKVNMNANQHADLHRREQEAIATVAAMFGQNMESEPHEPKVNGFDYKELMMRYQEFEEFLHPDLGIVLHDAEAAVVKYCDKLEGFCEALHEIFAGNTAFTHGYSETTRGPYEVYTKVLGEFTKTFPIFGPMRQFEHPLLALPMALDIQGVVSKGKEHNTESIGAPTGYAHYDAWKRISLKRGGEWILQQMTTRVE